MQAGKPRKPPDLNYSDLNHPTSDNIKKSIDVENDFFIHDFSNKNVNTYLVPIARTLKPAIVIRLQQKKRAAIL